MKFTCATICVNVKHRTCQLINAILDCSKALTLIIVECLNELFKFSCINGRQRMHEMLVKSIFSWEQRWDVRIEITTNIQLQ